MDARLVYAVRVERTSLTAAHSHAHRARCSLLGAAFGCCVTSERGIGYGWGVRRRSVFLFLRAHPATPRRSDAHDEIGYRGSMVEKMSEGEVWRSSGYADSLELATAPDNDHEATGGRKPARTLRGRVKSPSSPAASGAHSAHVVRLAGCACGISAARRAAHAGCERAVIVCATGTERPSGAEGARRTNGGAGGCCGYRHLDSTYVPPFALSLSRPRIR
ncbi:hypothetical protein B0H17DRAFT_1203290 [Mycena rosella]|uniref:Uncharacterized protein n=1 Tax=Mycena rosella TaxID=1033263 RepID=A0AAD7DCB0_MYCRO|nr:hypothetical protein B0H17DRAFT_1203290 [Mycena rosella]